MKRIKIMAVILCILFAMTSLLAACGGEKAGSDAASNSSSAASQSTASNAAENKVPEKFVELSWYFMGSDLPDQAAVEAKVNEYLKEKLNCSVKFYPLDWNSLISKTQLMSASGTPYDITFTASWTSYNVDAAKGNYLDVKDMIDQYAPNIRKVLGDEILEKAMYNDKLYGIPVYKEYAECSGYLFRKDLVEKYKFDIDSIKTNADLEPMLKIIKENEPNVIPILQPWLFINDNRFVDVSESNLGLFVDNEAKDYKVINFYETPIYKNDMETARKWAQAGYMERDGLAKKDSASQRTREGAFFCHGSATKPGIAEEVSTADVQFVQKQMSAISYIGSRGIRGAMQAISNTSVNAERSLMLLDMMYTDKTLYNMVVFGLEGKNYTKVSENIVKPVENNGYPNSNNAYQFGNQKLQFLLPTENPKKWDMLDDFNRAAHPHITDGFVYGGTENFKSQYAAIKNTIIEFGDALSYGVMDPATGIPKFLEKLKAAGIEEVQKDIQAELDKWVAANKK